MAKLKAHGGGEIREGLGHKVALCSDGKVLVDKGAGWKVYPSDLYSSLNFKSQWTEHPVVALLKKQYPLWPDRAVAGRNVVRIVLRGQDVLKEWPNVAWWVEPPNQKIIDAVTAMVNRV